MTEFKDVRVTEGEIEELAEKLRPGMLDNNEGVTLPVMKKAVTAWLEDILDSIKQEPDWYLWKDRLSLDAFEKVISQSRLDRYFDYQRETGKLTEINGHGVTVMREMGMEIGQLYTAKDAMPDSNFTAWEAPSDADWLEYWIDDRGANSGRIHAKLGYRKYLVEWFNEVEVKAEAKI